MCVGAEEAVCIVKVVCPVGVCENWVVARVDTVDGDVSGVGAVWGSVVVWYVVGVVWVENVGGVECGVDVKIVGCASSVGDKGTVAVAVIDLDVVALGSEKVVANVRGGEENGEVATLGVDSVVGKVVVPETRAGDDNTRNNQNSQFSKHHATLVCHGHFSYHLLQKIKNTRLFCQTGIKQQWLQQKKHPAG